MNEADEPKPARNRANTGVEERLAAHRSQSFWRVLLAMLRALLDKATRYQVERTS